ncbi:MAG: hypothetical protein JNK86_06885 [Alphaproteobacteria bacterium]|nr:hypothetical protein [Alphaproteobacteria bacterium]
MRQVPATEIQQCLDEYLINIDRDPVHVKVSGVRCPDAVIISEGEFRRLKHAENSFHTIRSIARRLVSRQSLPDKKINLNHHKTGRKK